MVSPIIDVKHLDYRYPQQATDQLVSRPWPRI